MLVQLRTYVVKETLRENRGIPKSLFKDCVNIFTLIKKVDSNLPGVHDTHQWL